MRLKVSITNLESSRLSLVESSVVGRISSLPHLGKQNVQLFHSYTQFDSDRFGDVEFYLEIVQSSFFSADTVALLENSVSLVEAIAKDLNRDAVVRIQNVQFVIDWRIIQAAYVVVPIVLLLSICGCIAVLWVKKRKEKNDTYLLLS